jgi:CHAT domain-containing protein
MIGMTWALFSAGARCAVVSLWPVDDFATSALMQTFWGGFATERVEILLRAATRLEQTATQATTGV